MRCVVTGGAGFIGSNLAAALLHRRDEVVIVDDFSSGYRSNVEPLRGVRVVEGDVRSREVVEKVIEGSEVVFHLAASVGNKRSIDNPVADSEINVLGTINVLEACRKFGVRKIVVSSSAGIFGELKTIPIREDHPVEPDTPYGASKLCEEKLALSYAKLYNLEAVCLRYFNVYGPNQRFDAYGNVIPIFVFKMLRGETLSIFGDGEQTRDFVNVADVVRANLNAGDSVGVSGAFNIASGTRITINHLVQMLTSVSGLSPHVEHVAPRLGDVRDSLADVSSARERLNYTPSVSMEAGLQKYVEWARREVSNS